MSSVMLQLQYDFILYLGYHGTFWTHVKHMKYVCIYMYSDPKTVLLHKLLILTRMIYIYIYIYIYICIWCYMKHPHGFDVVSLPGCYLLPFFSHGLTWIQAWISNHMLNTMWDEITNPFPNINCATVEVREWISNFIPHIIMDVITYPCWD